MGERPAGVSIWRWHVGGACRRLAAGRLAVLLLVACAPAAAPAPSAAPAAGAAPAGSRAGDTSALQRIVDGARQEGTLSIIWGAGILGGTEGIQRLTDGMNKQYGLNVEVKYTPGPSMPEMAARVVQEYQAGRTAATDVSVGYAQHMLALIAGDALEPVDWAAWAPNVQDPAAAADNGRAVAVQSSTPGITYNTAKISGDLVPHSLQELLEPRYKGRVASTPFAASFDNLAVPELWGEQRTTDYLLKFADQIAGLMRCNEMDRLASGEYEILAIQCSQGEPLQWKARGAPIDFAIAADAPLILPLYLTVPKLSAHPNAAKLWINYLLSREAQDILYETNFSDAAFIPGSRTAPDIEKLQATGVQFTTVDVAFYQRNDEKDMARMLAKFQDILRKQR
jgi:ABC-type Fe3+ transport system substrate-binding protein